LLNSRQVLATTNDTGVQDIRTDNFELTDAVVFRYANYRALAISVWSSG
jgi:hypothetical protein